MKRSERLVDMTKYFMANPHTLTSLPFFADRYHAAKSSISEDLGILKHSLAQTQTGLLETVAGAAGGARYIPFVGKDLAQEYLEDLAGRIQDSSRILPGGFVYLSDILSSPQDLRKIGKIIATRYAFSKVDAVMTVETKGIALAEAVARFLNVPFVTARKRSKVTEGATVSVNYISSSIERVSKMALPTRALPKKSNVLIIDDFMKGGGTLTGMQELVKEFEGTVAGICVLCEAEYDKEEKLVSDYVSLINISKIDFESNEFSVTTGNFLTETDFDRF